MLHSRGRIPQGVSPGAIIRLDAMHELLFGEGVQRAIHGNFIGIGRKFAKNLRHAQRTGSLGEHIQHRKTHRCPAKAGAG